MRPIDRDAIQADVDAARLKTTRIAAALMVILTLTGAALILVATDMQQRSFLTVILITFAVFTLIQAAQLWLSRKGGYTLTATRWKYYLFPILVVGLIASSLYRLVESGSTFLVGGCLIFVSALTFLLLFERRVATQENR